MLGTVSMEEFVTLEQEALRLLTTSASSHLHNIHNDEGIMWSTYRVQWTMLTGNSATQEMISSQDFCQEQQFFGIYGADVPKHFHSFI